jgi:hypothetical protein
MDLCSRSGKPGEIYRANEFDPAGLKRKILGSPDSGASFNTFRA